MVKNLKVDGELHILRCSFDIVASGQCSPQKISCCESCVNRMCTNNHLLHWCCTLQPAASMTHHTKDKCVSRSWTANTTIKGFCRYSGQKVGIMFAQLIYQETVSQQLIQLADSLATLEDASRKGYELTQGVLYCQTSWMLYPCISLSNQPCAGIHITWLQCNQQEELSLLIWPVR